MGSLFKRRGPIATGAGVSGASSAFFAGSSAVTGVNLSDRQQAVAPAGTIEGTPAGKRRRGRQGLGGRKTGLATTTVMSKPY